MNLIQTSKAISIYRLARCFSTLILKRHEFLRQESVTKTSKWQLQNYSTKDSCDESFLQIKKALDFGSKTAIYDQNGEKTYEALAHASLCLAEKLKALTDLNGERIAFITPNEASYVVSMWASWISGAIAVPLCKSHPPSEIEYVLQDSKPAIVLSTPEYSEMIDTLARKHNILHHQLSNFSESSQEEAPTLDDFQPHESALIIYTSGTTGRPKGALWNHKNMTAQMRTMIKAWHWSPNDIILHLLPLHHIHGVVNMLMCPLVIGGSVVMRNKFDPGEVWNHLLGKITGIPEISVFMAIPTIYMKLLQYYDQYLDGRRDEILEACKRIRLMVSGSASLHTPVFQRWKTLTSHEILERYGMSEIGMVLTNPYEGERVPGAVGQLFPGVDVKIIEEKTERVILQGNLEDLKETPGLEGQPGELLVKGSIFQEYWGKPEATSEAFTGDGWFKTGDTAVHHEGVFRIVGRTSVDIIKSGGYKISALDVERHLLDHENIQEVAVLGIPDDTWGQRVAALVGLKDPSTNLTLDDLRAWCKTKMAPYQAPTELKVVKEIERNAMGKINKKELVTEFSRDRL